MELSPLQDVHGYTPHDVCTRLAELAAAVPPDRAIVEIGVNRGRSACYLGAGALAGGSRVTAVDPWDLPGKRGPTGRNRRPGPATFTDPAIRVDAEQAVYRHGLSNVVDLVQGFSTQVAGEWNGPPIGLLFVDGDHTAEGVRGDILSWQPHLAGDAIVVFDDYGPSHPDVPVLVDGLREIGLLELLEVVTDSRGKPRLAVTRLCRPDLRPLTIAVITGLRPELLDRTLSAFTGLYPEVWHSAHRIVWHNTGGAEDVDRDTTAILDRHEWHQRHTQTGPLMRVGEVTNRLAGLLPPDGVMLRLEDDLEARWMPSWPWLAYGLLAAGFRQIRTQLTTERQSERNMVTKRPNAWRDRGAYRTSATAHYSHRGTMMDIADFRSLLPYDHERHAASKFAGPVAQLQPGILSHLAGPENKHLSLRRTVGST